MEDIKRSADVLITEVELMNSSAERVYEWYVKRCDIDGKIEINDILDRTLEVNLLDRNERLINLAIAKYGVYPDTVRKIFNKALEDNDEVMTLACFSNTVLGRIKYSISSIPDSLVENRNKKYEWFSSLNERQIKALFENPTINQVFLVSFLSGKEYWNLIDEEMRFTAIGALCLNPRMSKKYDDKWMSGYAEYSYNEVFNEAWNLCKTVPTSKKWAMYLGELYSKIPDPPGSSIDRESVIKRWMIDDEDDKEYDKGKKSYLNPYEQVRAGIYRFTITNKYTKDGSNKEYFESEDLAIRWASYRKLYITSDEIHEAYERDGLLAISAMLDAYNVWSNKETRQALHDICWEASGDYENYHLDSANHFNYYKERYEEKYPEWFKEDEDTVCIDEDELGVNMGRLKENLSILQEVTFSHNAELLAQILRVEKETKKKFKLLLFLSGLILVVILWKIL